MIDQTHNFYDHHCKFIEQSIYLKACRRRIALIADGDDAGRFPLCVEAIRLGLCPAVLMTEEEIREDKVIYYRDRDDCGPGIVKRTEMGQELRTAEDVNLHHAMLSHLRQEPFRKYVAVRGTAKIHKKRIYPEGKIAHDDYADEIAETPDFRDTEGVTSDASDLISEAVRAL